MTGTGVDWLSYRVLCGDCGYCGPWFRTSYDAVLAEHRHHRDYLCANDLTCIEARSMAHEDWLTGTSEPELPFVVAWRRSDS